MTAEHDTRDQTVQVHPGAGVVARFRDTVVLALPASPAQEPGLDELLRLVEERVLRDRPAPGRRVARALAGLLAQADPEDLPGFAVVGPAEKGLALLVSGPVDVLVPAAGRDGAPLRRRRVLLDRPRAARRHLPGGPPGRPRRGAGPPAR